MSLPSITMESPAATSPAQSVPGASPAPPQVPPALAPLASAFARLRRAGDPPLDLRFVGAQAPSPGLAPGESQLAVRVGPRQVHLAWFAATRSAQIAPCPGCLDRRMLSMRSVDEQWAAQQGHRVEGCGVPFLTPALQDRVACLGTALREKPSAAQQVYSVDLVTQEIRVDELLADTFCDHCRPRRSPAAEGPALPLRDSVPARSGTSRLRGLLDYTLPTRALVNPVCGAAAPVAVPGYVQSITAPVFAQYFQRAFDAPPRSVGWSGLCLRTDESRVAGMLEALERQAGMLAPPDAVAVTASQRALGERAMDPTHCFAYDDESYRLPLGLTRYDPDRPLAWTWGVSLMSHRPLLVPTQLVYYDRIDASRHVKFVDNNSSGCALGACHEEAILKALLELLERDSFVIAWHRQLSLPRIDPGSCRDRKTAALLNRLDFLGFDIALLDGRLDMRVPSVIAVARRRDADVGSLSVGAGASLDAHDAVRSALLECATSIVEMPTMFRAREAHVRALAENPSRVKTVMDHSLLYALPHMAERLRWLDGSPDVRGFDDTYGAAPAWRASGDIAVDLARVLQMLRDNGLHEAVVVDLTTPEQRQLDFKTVRVIVPGLAPIDFGHPRNRVDALPRLQSAPAAAGLSSRVGAARNLLPHPFP